MESKQCNLSGEQQTEYAQTVQVIYFMAFHKEIVNKIIQGYDRCLSLGNAVNENKEQNFDRITMCNTKDCKCWYP